MKIKVTPKEKKLIDSLHAFDNKGTFSFCREDYYDHKPLFLHFTYNDTDNNIQDLIIDFSDTSLIFENLDEDKGYKYEDFTTEK